MSIDRSQSEKALVGCILDQSELAYEVKVEWFDDLRLATLVSIALTLLKEGRQTDASTVYHSAGAKYLPLIQECQNECPSPASFPYFRDEVMEGFEKKRLSKAAQAFLNAIPKSNGDMRLHISALENALARPIGKEKVTLTPKESAQKLTSHLEARFNLNGKRSGLETGFLDLDRMIDGLQFGEVTILGARPSAGKTAIGCNIANKICLTDKIPTLFLSLEMSSESLCRRMLSCRCGISMGSLRSGAFNQSDFTKMAAFNTILADSPMFIRESFGGMSASEAASLIRRGAKRKGVKLVVLDYLQKLKADSRHEKRTYEVAETSAAMVEAVRETGVAFLCLAQLNRESEKDKGRLPRLADLADSGQIERDADNVLLLHRDRADKNKPANLLVAKQRDGETGIVQLGFEGQFCRFFNHQPESND